MKINNRNKNEMLRLQKNDNLYHGNVERFTMTLQEGVLAVDLRGVHTCASACAALLHGLSIHGEAKAFCVMTDRALLALGDDCLNAVRQEDFPPIHGAIVVSDALLEVMESHVRQIARQGVVRVVFTSRDDALLWAAGRARLAVAQAAWVETRRSS